MGVRFPSVQSNVVANALPANATETVICTTPPFSPPLDSAIVLILWTVTFTPQTGTNNANMKIRRGTTTAGVLVNVSAQQGGLASGVTVIMSGWYFDSPPAIAGQQYSLTIVQNTATVAGTIGDVAMLCFAL